MRVKTGIDGFDELTEGGLIQGRQYLVSGSPGSGKTTFGVQFITAGALVGETGAYIALTESIDTIVEDMSRYNFHVNDLIEKKKLFFLDIGPNNNYREYNLSSRVITPGYTEQVPASPKTAPPSPQSVFKSIETLVKHTGAKRLVIDSLSAIRFTTQDPAQEERSISKFIRNMKTLNCTAILLSELIKPDAYTIEQFASHGVIFLHNFMDKQDHMRRALQIIKMRGTKHDCDMHNLEFTPKGIRIRKSTLI